MIYLVLFLISGLAAVVLDRGRFDAKSSNAVYWLLCLVFIIVSGVKYRVGGDPLTYADEYDSYPTFGDFGSENIFQMRYSPLFYVIVALCKLVSNDFVCFQIVQALVINIAVFWIINRYSRFRFTAVFFYYILFYLYFWEVMRETFCIALFLFAVPSLLQKRYLRYYLIVLPAVFIHISASFLLVFPLLYKFVEKGWLALWVGAFVCAMLFILIFKYPTAFALVLPGKIMHKIMSYASVGIYGPTVVLNYIHACALAILTALSEKICGKDKIQPILKIYILLFILTAGVQGIYRLTNYVCIFEAIVISNLLFPVFRQLLAKQFSSVVLAVSVSIILVLKAFNFTISTDYYSSGTHFYNLYYPYETVFAPESHYWREAIYYHQMEEQREMHARNVLNY